MADLEDVMELKTMVGRLQRQVDQAQGRLDSQTQRLQDEFGCATLKEAEVLLDKLSKDEVRAKAQFEKAFKAFELKWGNVIQEIEADGT